MVIFSSFRKITALVMLMAVINMIAGSYFLQREFLEPLREKAASVTPAIFADDSEEYGIGDHKPPKTSYVTYECLSDSDNVLIGTLPATLHLDVIEPFRFIPDVYADIFVPPKILPSRTNTFIA